MQNQQEIQRFADIFNQYYSFFKKELNIDISSLLPIDKPIQTNYRKTDIIEFLLDISNQLNSYFDKAEMKKTGQYCTEDLDVINIVLTNIIDFDSKDTIQKKVLEPSCGVGIFIISIIHNLFESKLHTKEEMLNFVNEKIVGFEISPELLYFTKLNIKALMVYLYKDIEFETSIFPQVFLSDTTYKPNTLGEQSLFGDTIEFIETAEAKQIKENIKFDMIVGNPPYVTLYGRRDNKKSEVLRDYYIDNYKFVPKTVKNGKFNLSMFFFEQSLEWMNDNGKLSFIIDISFFEQAYKYLRKYLLENTKITYLITDLTAFNVGSGQIIISLQKSTNIEVNRNNIVNVIKHDINKKQLIKQDVWFNEDENKFSIIDEEIAKIMKKIENKTKPLDFYFSGKKPLRTCCMLLDMEDTFTYSEKFNTENELMPYYEGSKSLKEPYGELYFTKYFEYNKELQDKINDELHVELIKQGIKNKKRIGFGDLQVYKSPKLFIRQSSKRIIATVSFETAAANNSLYVLSEGKDDKDSIDKLKVALALLNSEVLTFYALAKRIIRIAKGKQPQIKIGDIIKIPLTYENEVCEELIKYVDIIIKNPENKKEAIGKIDSFLYDYFEINKDEIDTLRYLINSY